MPTHSEITDALEARKQWEDRQAVWYQMRHDGIRRTNKPWRNAADMHFPLVDTTIEKLKPYYVQQVLGQELIANFYSLAPELAPHQAAAGQWYDYQLRSRSNFEAVLFVAIDQMLMAGKCPLKVYWDPEKKRLEFDAIHPLHLIVPEWTKRLADADWVVHVQQFSKAAYKRNKHFNQDVLERICASTADDTETDRAKRQREGITHSKTSDQIIVWEVFSRDDAKGWKVDTYSPVAPTVKIRDTFALPYTKGVFAEGAHPFAELDAEKKETGYYSSRGIAERLAPFEMSLCRDWNAQKDHQQLTTSPLFYAEKAPPNLGNLRMDPGAILPFAIQAVQFPSAPVDLGQQMVNTRMVAEQAVAMPDFGTGQQVNTKQRKTAREIDMIGSVMNQGVDMRGRTFRGDMKTALDLGWALLQQYAPDQLTYFYQDELGSLPQAALAGRYQIELTGTADSVNRPMVLQRAQGRYQMFANNPMIDQGELIKSVLDADDPRLTRRLYRATASQAAGQTEDQAQEITVLLIGFQSEIKSTDDHAVHLQCIAGFLQRAASTGPSLTPQQRAAVAQHGLEHCKALAQTGQKPAPEIQQLAQQLSQMGQQASAELQGGQAPQAQPQQMPAQFPQ